MRRGFSRAAGKGRQLDIGAARYHAGPPTIRPEAVCRKVIANMVASGFGAWTANARASAMSQSGDAPGSGRRGASPIQSKREKNNLYVKYRLTFNHKLLIFNKYEVRFAGDFNVGDS